VDIGRELASGRLFFRLIGPPAPPPPPPIPPDICEIATTIDIVDKINGHCIGRRFVFFIRVLSIRFDFRGFRARWRRNMPLPRHVSQD
jgi:hypothetical protein